MPLNRAEAFCRRFGLRAPILLAPMAGVPAPALSVAIADAGGLGSCGALLMKPDDIAAWTAEVRHKTNGAFQLNLWIPDPPPQRDAAHEARIRTFLEAWGPAVPAEAADTKPPDFAAQCEALLTNALDSNGWNRTRTAAVLGITRDAMRYRIKKFHLLPLSK